MHYAALYVVKPPGYLLDSTPKKIEDLTIERGEVKDLGDIVVKPME